MGLEEAEDWPDLLSIVRERVKPERDKNKRDNYRLKWWKFGETQPGLYKAIAPLERCLVTARVTKHLSFSFQPTDLVFSEALYVFPLDSYTAFTALQSRVHEPWTRQLSSSLEERLRYAASDCFDTFPFPKPTPVACCPRLKKPAKPSTKRARNTWWIRTRASPRPITRSKTRAATNLASSSSASYTRPWIAPFSLPTDGAT